MTNDSHTVEEDTCDQFITDGSSCSQFLSFKEEIFLPAFSKFFPYAISNEILFEIEGNTTMFYNYGIKYFFSAEDCQINSKAKRSVQYLQFLCNLITLCVSGSQDLINSS